MKAYAEIVESSLHLWKAQMWQWDQAPPFGSIVTIEQHDCQLMGIVTYIETGTVDGKRAPFVYQKTEQELKKEQPHIFTFLNTTISCLPLGFIKQNEPWHQIPSQPPKIHAFVSPATPAQLNLFFAQTTYLAILFQAVSSQTPIDELILALTAQLKPYNVFTPDYTERFIDMFCLLCGNDYRRLKLFLHRFQLHCL
ncbi:MAG: hypothetical protein WCE21_00520 [Candidatus Babeliales bacterium]